MKRSPAICFISVIGATTPLPALGEETSKTDLPDRFTIRLGAFGIVSRDTEIRVNSSDGLRLGTRFNYQDDLDGDERVTAPWISGYYRFGPRHCIDFSWYDIETDGTTTLAKDIDFGDRTFTLGTRVSSFLDLEVLKIAYTFSFLHQEKIELGVTAGLFIADIATGLAIDPLNLPPSAAESAEVTAPLPVIGFRLVYGISPRWKFRTSLENFFLNYDGFRGSLVDLSAVVEHQTFKHVGFGLGFDRFATTVKLDTSDWDGELQDIYAGWLAYTTVYF